MIARTVLVALVTLASSAPAQGVRVGLARQPLSPNGRSNGPRTMSDGGIQGATPSSIRRRPTSTW